jgi:hypothetical protein
MLSQVSTMPHPATGWAEKDIALSWMGMLLLIHAQKRFHYLGQDDSANLSQTFLSKKHGLQMKLTRIVTVWRTTSATI